ncbi:MAG: hypothetical protein WCD80_16265 [Desulfobaccales bacterium]
MGPNSLHVDSLASPRWLLLVCTVLLLFACQAKEPAASFKKEVKGILNKLCTTLVEPVFKGDVPGIETVLSEIEPQAIKLCRRCPFQVGVLNQHGEILAVHPPTGRSNNFSSYDLVIKTINSKQIQQQRFFLQDGPELYIICAPILRQDKVIGLTAIAISAEEAKSKWGLTEKEFMALNFNT